jgi:hypothetical protein
MSCYFHNYSKLLRLDHQNKREKVTNLLEKKKLQIILTNYTVKTHAQKMCIKIYMLNDFV